MKRIVTFVAGLLLIAMLASLTICQKSDLPPLYSIAAPKVFPDGSGNFLVVYEVHTETQNGTYLQKLDGEGLPLWGTNGIELFPSTTGWAGLATENKIGRNMPQVQIVNIGKGEFDILAVLGDGLWMQRIDADGHFLWPASSLPPTSNSSNNYPASTPSNTILKQISSNGGNLVQFITDAQGNTVVGSQEGNYYLQKVDANGNLLWANEEPPYFSVDYNSDISMDDQGNIFVAGTGQYHYYVQKVDEATGEALWPSPIELTGDSFDRAVSIACDEQGGCFVSWVATSDNIQPYVADLYTCQFDSSGHLKWQTDPLRVNQTAYVQMFSDHVGGAYILYEYNWNEDITKELAHLERIKPDGSITEVQTMPWFGYATEYDNGGLAYQISGAVEIMDNSGSVKSVNAAGGDAFYPDGAGGFVFSWTDDPQGIFDKYRSYVQRAAADGSLLWGVSGGVSGVRLDQGG